FFAGHFYGCGYPFKEFFIGICIGVIKEQHLVCKLAEQVIIGIISYRNHHHIAFFAVLSVPACYGFLCIICSNAVCKKKDKRFPISFSFKSSVYNITVHVIHKFFYTFV